MLTLMDFPFVITLGKSLLLAFLQCFILLFAGNLQAETAKEIITILKEHRGAIIAENVTAVRGHRGQDQPKIWEVSTRMSDGERVFVVTDKQIIADTVYSSGGGVVIDLRRLRIDSGDVFRVVNRLAAMGNVGFDSIDYELRAAPLGNAPLWVVHLRDYAGKDVGRVEVSGESAEVLRSKWFKPRIANREPIGPEGSVKQSGLRSYDVTSFDKERRLIIREKDSLFKGEPAQRVKRGFRAVGMGFNRISAEQSAVFSQRSRYRHPATSRQRTP